MFAAQGAEGAEDAQREWTDVRDGVGHPALSRVDAADVPV